MLAACLPRDSRQWLAGNTTAQHRATFFDGVDDIGQLFDDLRRPQFLYGQVRCNNQKIIVTKSHKS